MKNPKRSMSCCVVVCVLMFVSQTLGDNVYDVIIYDGFDPGWSMDGGTITTNGFIGTVNKTNIGDVFTDWSVRFTSPTDSYELTPANSEFSFPFADSQMDEVEVTAQDIMVLFDPFRYVMALTSATGQSITWDGPRFRQDFGFVLTEFGNVRLADGTMASGDFLGQCEEGVDPGCMRPEGLLVAVVPEPMSLSLLLLAVGIAASKYRRSVRRTIEA